jgi:alginate O-acetyltransferase complex protein AlgI
VTMLLCGLWHGASWNYVAWGGIHGASLAIHRIWRARDPLMALKNNKKYKIIWSAASHMLTLSVILIGWLFFRAQSWSDAAQYFSRLVTWSQDGTRLVSPYIIIALVTVLLTHIILQKDRNWAFEVVHWSVPLRITYYTVMALLICCLGATDSSPFIYFQY